MTGKQSPVSGPMPRPQERSNRIPFRPKHYKPHKAPPIGHPLPLPQIEEHHINPGRIPPNYTQTWAVDVYNGDFKTNTLALSVVDAELDWGKDTITVLNADGVVMGAFTKQEELFNPYPKQMSWTCIPPVSRLYITLETSPRSMDRRIAIAGLVTEELLPITILARVLEDDIDYDKEVFEGIQSIHGEDVPVPWKLPATPSEISIKKPENPWRLIGKNLHSKDAGFFLLLYYNEFEGKLKAFLYNYDLPITNQYIFTMTFWSVVDKPEEGRVREQLTGALFPTDQSNPRNWSTAEVIIPTWAKCGWTEIREIPVLYPMFNNIQYKIAEHQMPPSDENYLSPFEVGYTPAAKNIYFEVTIRPLEKMTFTGILQGEAEGLAQSAKNNSDSLMSELKVFANAIKNGKEWYGNATKAAALLSIASVTEFSGVIAYAAFMISMVQSIFNKEDTMSLAIQLTLKGKIYGDIINYLQKSLPVKVYLPGRFSIKDAFERDDLSKKELEHIDCQIPRFDGTIGLFGYRYCPADVEIDIFRFDAIDGDGYHAGYSVFFIPYNQNVIYDMLDPLSPEPASTSYSYTIRKLLPVIYNVYSRITEIYPSDPALNSDPVIFGTGKKSRIFFAAFFEEVLNQVRVSFTKVPSGAIHPASDPYLLSDLHSVNPSGSIYDKNRGFELNVQGAYSPTPCTGSPSNHDFVPVRSTAWANLSGEDPPFNPVSDSTYVLCTSHGNMNKLEASISPLHDIVYYWDIAYRVDEPEEEKAYRVQRMFSPVSINLGSKYMVESFLPQETEPGPEPRQWNSMSIGCLDEAVWYKRKSSILQSPHPGRGNIESPYKDQKVSGDFTVKGWCLSIKGISEVQIKIDNRLVKHTTCNITRDDVAQTFPDYGTDKAGFEYKLDSTALINGQHELTISAIEADGQVAVSCSRRFIVNN